jgi:hypothetical protein
LQFLHDDSTDRRGRLFLRRVAAVRLGRPVQLSMAPERWQWRSLEVLMAETVPELSISTEKVCFFILKARELEAKDVVTEPDPASNPADDGMRAVLEDHRDDATSQEVRAFISGLTEDERVDLVTLMWLGRGDGTEWSELRREAARLHTDRTAQYLMGHPLLADHLDEALARLGHRCAG